MRGDRSGDTPAIGSRSSGAVLIECAGAHLSLSSPPPLRLSIDAVATMRDADADVLLVCKMRAHEA
jgi:hypothetical protein